MKKDYQSALQTLQDHPESLPKELWHFNLGLTYARLENWPLARFHFLSAEKAGMMTTEVEQNQQLVVEKLSVGKLEKATVVTDYFYQAMKYLSGGEFITMSLVIFLGGLLSLKKSPSRGRFLVVMFLTTMPLSLLWVTHQWTEGIVTVETKVQDGPSKIFTAITDVPVGVKLITVGEGDWKKVLYPSRFRGWISKASIKELE